MPLAREDSPLQKPGMPLRVLNRAAAGFLLVLAFDATWPLWAGEHDFPRVPFLASLAHSDDWLRPAWMPVAIVAELLILIRGSRLTGRTRKWATTLAAGAFALLILGDQHRFQPWVYELLIVQLVLAWLPAAEAVTVLRWIVASIYFHSGLSKLDATFIEAGGGQIVDGLLLLLRSSRDAYPPTVFQSLAAALPIVELLVAGGLLWRRTRWLALACSIGLHAILIAALGPWGANHRSSVLLWNAFFIVQNVCLFASREAPTMEHHEGRAKRIIIRALAAFVILFPFAEPWGLCDVWPAWAVYATRPERARIWIAEDEAARLPADIATHLTPPRFEDGRRLLKIDRWSLEATCSPIYPQNRFRLGVALAVAERYRLESILVELDSGADRWTGARNTTVLTGTDEIRAAADRYWLNARPSPFADNQDAVR